jgi:hypothetical protein
LVDGINRVGTGPMAQLVSSYSGTLANASKNR